MKRDTHIFEVDESIANTETGGLVRPGISMSSCSNILAVISEIFGENWSVITHDPKLRAAVHTDQYAGT